MTVLATELQAFVTAVLRAAGLDAGHAGCVAATLVEGDLLGYTTHGTGMLPLFVGALERGAMCASGEPCIVQRGRNHALIDGQMLPGPVVMQAAVQLALQLAADEPLVAVSVRRSANTACLATYLPAVAASGRIALLHVANPDARAVSPPGAAAGGYGTDPFAACVPTPGDPLLMDFATSATTNRMTERARRAGQPLGFAALVDAAGQPSRDAGVLDAEPPGAIAALGAPHAAHKGFALALLVEVLGGCLAGYGRQAAAEHGQPAGSACLLQVIDAAAFAGRDAFLAETGRLVEAMQALPAADGSTGVRVPGQRAFERRRAQLAAGIDLHADVPPLLARLAARFDVPLPDGVAAAGP